MQVSRIKLNQLFQMLAIEDFRTLSKYAILRLTTPLFNVHYVFERDLTRVHELTPLTRQLPPGLTIRICRGENEITPLASNLGRAGVSSAILAERIKRDDFVVIAFDEKDEIAAYSWATFTDVWMKEIRATLLLGRHESFGIDTFVLPLWRGKGLQYALETRKYRHLSELGYRRLINHVNALNSRSLKTQVSEHKRKVATIYSAPIAGVVVVRKCLLDAVLRIEKRPWWRGEVPQSSC